MYRAKTSTPLRDLIKLHDENPGNIDFVVDLVNSGFFCKILYKKVTITKSHKIRFSSKLLSKILEINFMDIFTLKRKVKNKRLLHLTTIGKKTYELCFLNYEESKKFFDLISYSLSVDPSSMR